MALILDIVPLIHVLCASRVLMKVTVYPECHCSRERTDVWDIVFKMYETHCCMGSGERD